MKRKTAYATAFATIAVIVFFLSYNVGGKQTPHNHISQTSMAVYGNADDNTPREDKAEVNIKAPDKVKVGDMIVVDLSGSLGGGFDYEVEPMPPQLRTFDDGKVIVCGTGGKNVTYTFMISCALGGDSDVAVHKVKVTGAQAPGPPPNPGDNLVEKVKEWASDVESDSKRDDAIKLAQSFASVAIINEQGTFDEPIDLIRATKNSNVDALGKNLNYWKPFLDSLMLELKAMDQLKLLSDMPSHTRIWKDVATGLREYADTLD